MSRINNQGYREVRHRGTGEFVPLHRLVADRKFGGLRVGFHVHHRDSDKLNNRRRNLLEVHPKVHARLHLYPDACARCGRKGHWAGGCWAQTFWDGTPLVE